MRTATLIAIVCLGQISQPPAASNAVSESTELRYARAQTQLAEANLNRVKQSNRRVARSVPSSVVAEYERDVQVAEIRLAQVAAGRAAGEFQVWLRRAEAEHRTAETAWKNAMEVNDRVRGTFDPINAFDGVQVGDQTGVGGGCRPG